jgi:hypothetical protein
MIRIFQLIIASSVMMANAAPVQFMLPDTFGQKSEFKALAPQENYSSKDFYEYIDGGADVYIEAGMKSCVIRRYGNIKLKDTDIEVAVYDMGTSLNAFGIFRQLHTDRTHITGTESAVEPLRISFWKSERYVEVLDKSSKPTDASTPKTVARLIADQIKGDTLLPKEIKYLPDTLKKPSSERYWKSGFLSRSFLNGVISGEYQAKTGACTLFVMFCPSDSVATASLRKITKEFDGDNFRVQAFASKTRVAGCVGCTQNDFEKTFFGILLEQIRRQ